MSHVMLERVFDPPLTDELLEELTGRLNPCLRRNNVQWIRSHLSLDRSRLLCQFRAPDTDAVRDSLRQARIEHERVWPAEELVP